MKKLSLILIFVGIIMLVGIIGLAPMVDSETITGIDLFQNHLYH